MKRYLFDYAPGSSAGSAKCEMEKNFLSIIKVLLIPATLHRWVHNYKSRRALAQLDMRLLEDVGLSTEEAAQEYHKPFWQ